MDVLPYLGSLGGSAVVVLLLAVVSAVAFETANRRVVKFVEAAAWWPQAAPQQKTLMMNFAYPEEYLGPEALLDAFAFVVLFVGHHLLTGAMTLPVVVLGWSGAGLWGQALFLCAGLADVALEVYDIVKKTFLCFFPSKFKWLGPPCPLAYFVIVCVLHHPLAIALVIPMNLKYSDLPAYHYTMSSLLLAAGICFLAGEYKFTLDTDKRRDMLQYKAIAVIQFVTIWFTRGFVWFTQVYAALLHFRAQGDWPFFVGGCVFAALMSCFNLVMLVDCTTAALKWLPKPLPQAEQLGNKEAADTTTTPGQQAAPSPVVTELGAQRLYGTTSKDAVAEQSFKNGARKRH